MHSLVTLALLAMQNVCILLIASMAVIGMAYCRQPTATFLCVLHYCLLDTVILTPAIYVTVQSVNIT